MNFVSEVKCSGAFFVRSLVRDIGEKVGCCAMAVDIFRTAQGKFTDAESLIRSDAFNYSSILRDIIRVKWTEKAEDQVISDYS